MENVTYFMYKILSTDKHDRILVVKNSSFQVQIHNDIHGNLVNWCAGYFIWCLGGVSYMERIFGQGVEGETLDDTWGI